VCSYVPVPAAPHARPGGGAAGPLRPRPVHLESGRRAALPLAPRPHERAGLPGTVPAAHRRPSRAPVAGGRLPDGPAAGPARLHPGDGRVLRPGRPARPAGPAGRPSWRKAGRHEGFRIVGRGRQWDVRRVSRKVGEVRVPKAGWVRFRWSRTVPPDAKSYRMTLDRAGRWHVAFAVIPAPVPAPGNGQRVGIDRGWRSPRPCPPASCCTAPP
jgi:hypothetical protein